MPIFEVQGENGEMYEIDAPDQESAIVALKSFSPQTNLVEQTGTGVNEGLALLAGMPVDAATWALNKGISGANKVFGSEMGQIENPVGGSQSIESALSPFMSDAAPQTTAQRIGRRMGQEVGANAIPMLALASKPVAAAKAGSSVLDDIARTAQDNFGRYALADTTSAAAGGTAAGISQEVAPGNKTAEFLANLGASGATAGAFAKGFQRSANKSARDAVPDVDTLKSKAGDQYRIAEKNGVTASQQQTQKLANDVRDVAAKEGLISPTGRINPAYPKAHEAVKLLDDYAEGVMTPTQMMSVRKVLGDAARSVDPQEARIATIMLKKFDEFTSPLAPQIAAGNALYRKAMGGDLMETAIELAGSRAGQFSGSGFENALRTEFRALERKIIKGQLKGLSPDAVSAIKKVARGGPIENILRGLGRAAPTSIVNAGISGGMPFLVGNAIGGPGLGAAAAGGTMTTGAAARMAATGMQRSNADIASAILRNGGSLEQAPLMTGDVRGLLSSLVAGNAATTASEKPRDKKRQ